MAKINRFLISSFLIAIIVFVTPVFASNFISGQGTVMEVIDGDSLKVVDLNKKIYYLKLLGVNTKGNNSAFEYLNNELLGKNIFFSSDSNYLKVDDGIWFYNYVYYDGKLINSIILEKGLGYLNTEHKNIVRYSNLLQSEKLAKLKRFGFWENEEVTTSEKSKYKVNINTATAFQLSTLLLDVDNELAKDIVEYRKRYIFDEIEDIGNVDGFTQDVYKKNLDLMSVYTNINNTSEIELTTLTNITAFDARDIINFGSTKKFEVVEELFRENIISMNKFREIKYFIRAY